MSEEEYSYFDDEDAEESEEEKSSGRSHIKICLTGTTYYGKHDGYCSETNCCDTTEEEDKVKKYICFETSSMEKYVNEVADIITKSDISIDIDDYNTIDKWATTQCGASREKGVTCMSSVTTFEDFEVVGVCNCQNSKKYKLELSDSEVGVYTIDTVLNGERFFKFDGCFADAYCLSFNESTFQQKEKWWVDGATKVQKRRVWTFLLIKNRVFSQMEKGSNCCLKY